jgi:DNA-binding CsgD family transcriptional regulator
MLKERKGKKTKRKPRIMRDIRYDPRNEAEDRLLTFLMLAGEALAAPLRGDGNGTESAPYVPTYATPVEEDGSVMGNGAESVPYSGLLKVIEQIRALLAQDARLAKLIVQLREAFGDGDDLRLLFRGFFPQQRPLKVMGKNGKPILSAREVEVLREASHDLSHAEIAARLHIEKRTVKRHFDNIYEKLHVNKPMQAVSLAVAMGYLNLDVVEVVSGAAHCNIHEFWEFQAFLNRIGGAHRELNETELRSLAEFGLLLFVLSGAAALPLYSDMQWQPPPRGVVCELNAQGKVVRSFGTEHLRRVQGITLAPSHAARHGFTPGNLFVVHHAMPQQGLNDSAIVEFTPDGKFVRAFFGSREVGTQLCYAPSLAFDADGRLLVASGLLANRILTFSDGGATVQRFADCCATGLYVSASGKVYASQFNGRGCVVQVYDPNGRLLRTIGGTPAGVGYYGIAVNAHGHIFVNYTDTDHRSGVIEVYDADGDFLRSSAVVGLNVCQLTIDAQDRLYVPCQRTADLKIVSPDGKVLRRIDLQGQVVPYGVALGEGGRMWVSGVKGKEEEPLSFSSPSPSP